MSEQLFKVFNGPTPTTTMQQKITSTIAIKTMIQIATPATKGIRIVEWGVAFFGTVAAVAAQCELLSCTGAATVTAYADADITRLTDPSDEPSLITLGVAASGYNASAEGVPAAVDMLDAQPVPPSGQLAIQFPSGREPRVAINRLLRVRILVPTTAVDCQCYVTWRE